MADGKLSEGAVNDGWRKREHSDGGKPGALQQLAAGAAKIIHIWDSGFTINDWREGKTPKTKLQTPEYIQAPNSKCRGEPAILELGIWSFFGVWI